MKHIKNYQKFNEAIFQVDQNDPPELAADKTSTNKLDTDIKEFLNKKVTIDNIYMTYTDEKDLIKKLSAQKFIQSNTSDKKKIKFINPLIAMYAQASEKKRELKNLESDLDSQKETLSDRQSSITQNPELKNTLGDDIKYTQDKVNDIQSKISKIKNEIVTLERNTRDKLNQMKKDFENSKKRINYFIKIK